MRVHVGDGRETLLREGNRFNPQLDGIEVAESTNPANATVGVWVFKNFPTLPQKLFGETWQPQPRHDSFAVGNPEFDIEAVDKIISAKMKLRVVEMAVNASTFLKMKHFVKELVVVGARRNNETRVSPRKMVTFDVDEDFVLCCWEALKSGVFNIENEVHPFTLNHSSHSYYQIDLIECILHCRYMIFGLSK